MMEQAALPWSPWTVSRLALGGCPLGGHGWGESDDEAACKAVERACARGIDFFDTADIYGLGHSEQLLAKALGNRRRDVVIATKFGVRRTIDGRTIKDISPAYLREALEASLRRLQLDSIPLYYVHWPDGYTPIEDAIEELDRCREAGKIHAIGVSNFDAQQLRRACGVARISAAQVQFSLLDRAKAEALMQAAAECGVPLITWGSLAQGLLTGKYTLSSAFGADDRRSRYDNFTGIRFQNNLRFVSRLNAVARRLEKRPSQVALRWLLDTSGVGCALFGAKNPAQVDENCGACGWRLSEDDYHVLGDYEPSDDMDAAGTEIVACARTRIT